MDKNQNKPKMNVPRPNLSWLYIVIAAVMAYFFFTSDETSASKEINYTQFKEMVTKGYAEKIVAYDDNTVDMFIKPDHIVDVFKKDASKVGRSPSVKLQVGSNESLDKFLDEQEKSGNFTGTIRYEKKEDYFGMIFWNVAPLLFIIGIWIFAMRRMGGGGSGGPGNVFSVGKSKAQLFDKGSTKITFKDVAGQAAAKQEVQEIVDFLKKPQKYTELGGKIPKGALLVGPPGTGKTLLAKAVAGEADVPFFSISGSDFVEMFVGVGASRVRDLFRQAKEKSPCIIFIDEIDAVGRARGKNPSMGGNDERENTLNQLLTEMDGFGSNSGVIILAATNRVDILDKALLRAGRFDRQIYVDLPDLNERKEVFGVHIRDLKLDDTVDIDLMSRQTPGFSGADIANVCNEAALIAARHNKTAVSKDDFMAAIDRIVGGLEKKTKVMTMAEKRSIALHEAGHATISWFLEHANPLVKVTIVPRGRALGAAWYLPEERQITTKEQMLDEMCATLGGRAAEELFVGHISTGAMNDLERVTKQAYGMIAYAGMSDKLPNLCYYNNNEYNFNKPYSEHTAQVIDQEVQNMINEQYARAKQLLSEQKEGHNKLAQLLIDREVIYAEDVEKIFGKRPWTSRSEEIMALEEESAKKALEVKNNEEATKAEETAETSKDPDTEKIAKVENLVQAVLSKKEANKEASTEDKAKADDQDSSVN